MGIHFSFTLIYSSEGKYTSPKINEITGRYILPWFHHNWQLFAPDPPICQPSLFERHKTKTNHNQTPWKLVGYHMLLKNQYYRTGWTSTFFRLNEQYSREIFNLVGNPNYNIRTLERSRSYNLALEYAVLTLQHEGLDPVEIQLGLACVSIQKSQIHNDTLFFEPKSINQLH